MSDILTDLSAGVLTITLNRESKMNSLTSDMYSALANAFDAARVDDAVRAVVIQGSAKVFSAGNDLADFLEAPADRGTDRPVFHFLRGIATFPKPIVGAVCGPAVGIGTTMLLHCDFVYAGDNAKFSLPFVNLGLCPEAASSLLLPKIVGLARASELLLLGENFSAPEAVDFGLVNEVFEPESALTAAQETAAKLAAKPQKSVRVTKSLLRSEQMRDQILQRIETEAGFFSEMLQEPAAKEAFTAFMEKRAPNFTEL